jgi:hypothetical protein
MKLMKTGSRKPMVRAKKPRGRVALSAALSGVAAVATLGMIGAPVGAGGYDTSSPLGAAPSVSAPLTSSVTTPTATWAVVLMGKNDGFNLFWQLFTFDAASGHWTLVTPPGVADNGGLSVATGASGGNLLVGFETSQALKFSPLALTANGGIDWSPGGLEVPLVAVPSAVALGSGTHAVALASKGTQSEIVARSGDLTSWSPLVTGRYLAGVPSGRTCGVSSISAVTIDPSGIVLAGVSCRRPGIAGVLLDSDAPWHLAPIPVSGGLLDDTFAPIRLSTVGTTVEGLFAAGNGKGTNLVATWAPDDTRPWLVSPPLALGATGHVVAAGTGSGSTQFALVRTGASLRADVVDGPGERWYALPPLPASTATVAFEPNGQVTALTVDDTHFASWQLTADGGSWAEVQTVKVPIAFNSSG